MLEKRTVLLTYEIDPDHEKPFDDLAERLGEFSFGATPDLELLKTMSLWEKAQYLKKELKRMKQDPFTNMIFDYTFKDGDSSEEFIRRLMELPNAGDYIMVLFLIGAQEVTKKLMNTNMQIRTVLQLVYGEGTISLDTDSMTKEEYRTLMFCDDLGE